MPVWSSWNRAFSDLVQEAYALYRVKDHGSDEDSSKLFRQEFSREIEIHFIGVWNTVGSLGVPLSSFSWFNRPFYEFHDTKLSGIVKNAFHALAIDENRKNYEATLWDPEHKPSQVIEQVWSSGAHANIGGGYEDSRLSDIALVWMMEKAEQCGLALSKEDLPDTSACHAIPIRDSYQEFMNGFYTLVSERFHRPIGFTNFDTEYVHPSVETRYRCDLHYRPKNRVNQGLQKYFEASYR